MHRVAHQLEERVLQVLAGEGHSFQRHLLIRARMARPHPKHHQERQRQHDHPQYRYGRRLAHHTSPYE
jgi:hypothetical protein